jgi:hypothetical protein
MSHPTMMMASVVTMRGRNTESDSTKFVPACLMAFAII